MTRWDINLSKDGNQARLVWIQNKISTERYYEDKDEAYQIFQSNKNDVDIMTYSDYTGYSIHHGGLQYPGDVKGINVLAVDEISYPTALPATSITDTSFVANWYPLSDYEYLLEVSTDLVFSQVTLDYDNITIPKNITSYLVEGLEPDTDYYYRLRCKNRWNDISKYSVIRKVTTSPSDSIMI